MTKENENSKISTEELNEAELDQITGGAGGKQLIGHELTHVQQQGSSTVASSAGADPDGVRASGNITLKGKKINQN